MTNNDFNPEANNWQYELTVVHPAMEKWLIENGYTFEREVYMPDYGRADFVATHPVKPQLIVECKKDCKALTRTITQASDYRQQFNKQARIVIGVPNHTITDKSIALCQKRHVTLIGLNVPIKTVVEEVDHTLEEYITFLVQHRSEWGIFSESIGYLLSSINTPASRRYMETIAGEFADFLGNDLGLAFLNSFGKEYDQKDASKARDEIIEEAIKRNRNDDPGDDVWTDDTWKRG